MAGTNLHLLPSLRRLLAVACLALMPVSGFAESAFEAGNKQYEQAAFRQAREKYQEAVESGEWTPNLFYNLANTEYRLKNPGAAILNYERALALEPAHPEARRNLELLRNQTGAKLFQPRWWAQIFPVWHPDVFAIMVAVAGWLCALSLVVLWLRRRGSPAFWWTLAICAAFVSGYGKLALWSDLRMKNLAIITQSGSVARLAPADRAEVAENLPAGSQVRILSERGAWVYCALPDNELGWVPAQALDRVRIRRL